MARPRRGTDATRASASIAGLVVFNALIFHEILAGTDARVRGLLAMERASDPVAELVETWDYIEREIDYVPIFRVAHAVLDQLAAGEVDDAIRSLCQGAREVVRKRAALRHDLMGRVYHRLLLDAKYLATYYTSVPAATMVSKLLFLPDRTGIAWDDPDALKAVRIADLACGTGTLLMAASEAVADNHVRATAEAGTVPQLEAVHRVLLEDTIHGYDVLTTALHLTASTLALRASTTAFDHTNLYCMPFGGPTRGLGSIEFLESREVNAPMTLFREGVQVRGGGGEVADFAELPDLDFCLMNPPFARSVVGNLLFGSIPKPQRAPLQARLGRVLRANQAEASTVAGLGAVFVAVAHAALKPRGRMALVLSKAVLSGVAWTRTRELLSRAYDVEFVIVSQDPRRWNFSENTHLSEALLIAVKRSEDGESLPARDPVFVNLWRNPSTVFEALSAVRSIVEEEPPILEGGQGSQPVMLGDEKVGETFRVPARSLTSDSWGLYGAFAQVDLARTAAHLRHGRVKLPGLRAEVEIPLSPLGELGGLGPDVRDIQDAFTRTTVQTQFRAHWGHKSNDVKTLAREANTYLDARGVAGEGRPLRDADLMWSRAGKIMVTARLRLNTYRVAAVRLPEIALGSGWWPLRLSNEVDEAGEKAIVLWLNSTLGLVGLLATRVDTEGAWTQFKKPSLGQMRVLDPRALTGEQLGLLAAAYDDMAEENFGRFPAMATDPLRNHVDSAIAGVLGLQSLETLRALLGQEPVVSTAPLA